MDLMEDLKNREGLMLGKAFILFLGVVVALFIALVISNQLADMKRLSTKTRSRILADDFATSIDLMSAIDEESGIHTPFRLSGPKFTFTGDHIEASYSEMEISIREGFHDTVFHTSDVPISTEITAEEEEKVSITDNVNLWDAVIVERV